jgi:pantoate--beta-alanine ligase
MIVARTRAELATVKRSGSRGLVMTMGALHPGHATLLRQARLRCATVIATIFVNPLQFGPGEDFDRYPRTLDEDLAVCEREQVDVVFAPPREEIFPTSPVVTVSAGPVGELLEGTTRPGHFSGVLTIVNRMLHLVGDVESAFFGEKDYQQLVLIRQMVDDFGLPVEIIGVPTVREPDGVALSSRNRYLSIEDRTSARALSAALRAGGMAASDGASFGDVLAAAGAVLRSVPNVGVDYLELTDPALGPPPSAGPARLLVAARVGSTRLIDNIGVHLHGTTPHSVASHTVASHTVASHTVASHTLAHERP